MLSLVYRKAYADVIKQAADKESAKLVLISTTDISIYHH
jgi:hypothetical protein